MRNPCLLKSAAKNLVLLAMCAFGFLGAQSIRVATVNVWSGLDYQGVTKVGEFETERTRNMRLDILLGELRDLNADIIALQEANPVSEVAAFLAEALGYDYIAQRANGGIKLGCLGIPSNLNEGLVILARPELGLTLVDVWGLSGTFGVFGNIGSFHFSDRNIALVASVKKEGRSITIINAHLASNPPDNEQTRVRLEELMDSLGRGPQHRRDRKEELARQGGIRIHQMKEILRRIQEETNDRAVILLGDFNASPESPEIQFLREQGFLDASEISGWGGMATWDIENPNVRYSLRPPEAPGDLDLLGLWYDTQSRRIDYIFPGPAFQADDIRSGLVFLTEPKEGVHASDHYGFFAEINLAGLEQKNDAIADPSPAIEALPILTYDTDVGFGYGVKAFFLNPLGWSESFDAIVFNSTKGERWYRFVFSLPDFELRQGKVYPISLDLIVDYDKYLNNNFFGMGPASQSSDAELYTKEPLELQFVVSRGWTERLVGQIGARFRTVRNFNYPDTSAFAFSLPSINHGRSQALTIFSSIRYDSRDSFVNPSRGSVLQLDAEIGRDGILSDYSLESASFSLQTYHVLFYPKTVFAARVFAQVIGGNNLPVHAMATLGGNRTLRGYPQDRFLDKTALVANLEIRFPIVWRFGGVLFSDAGKVGESPGRISLFRRGWKTNAGLGLRLLMDTFVVRADLGISREGTGFYLNFGHIF